MGHGDRTPNAKPLSEILPDLDDAQFDVHQFVPPEDVDALMRRLEPKEGLEWRGAPELREPLLPTMVETDDIFARMQAAQIAAQSFGDQGTHDVDILLIRAEAVFNYIKNGLA